MWLQLYIQGPGNSSRCQAPQFFQSGHPKIRTQNTLTKFTFITPTPSLKQGPSRCHRLIVHDQIPFSGHPLDTRYEGWEADVGPMDFLELVFNKEAWKAAESSNFEPRTHPYKRGYNFQHADQQDFNSRLRTLSQQPGYPQITIKDYGDQENPEETEGTDVEERFMTDDFDEIDLRAMAFKRHRRIKEDEIWEKRRKQPIIGLDYINDERFKMARENYIDEPEGPKLSEEQIQNFITKNGSMVDVRDIELMWGKNKTVPKLDQIQILNPYRETDYFYDEVYTHTETTPDFLYKHGHAFFPGEREPFEDEPEFDPIKQYKYKDSDDPFGLEDRQSPIYPKTLAQAEQAFLDYQAKQATKQQDEFYSQQDMEQSQNQQTDVQEESERSNEASNEDDLEEDMA